MLASFHSWASPRLKLYFLAWVDCNHSKQTITWMDENFKFVPKRLNPPNVSQARPIENFWVCLLQKVYEGDWEAKTEQQLNRRIKFKVYSEKRFWIQHKILNKIKFILIIFASFSKKGKIGDFGQKTYQLPSFWQQALLAQFWKITNFMLCLPNGILLGSSTNSKLNPKLIYISL